jgi:hypothetical protein
VVLAGVLFFCRAGYWRARAFTSTEQPMTLSSTASGSQPEQREEPAGTTAGQTLAASTAARPRPAPGQLPDHPLAGALAGLVAGLAPAAALYTLLVVAGVWLGRAAPLPFDAVSLPVPVVLVLLLGCTLCGVATTLIHTPAERFELVHPGRAALLAFVPGCIACLMVWILLPNEWSPALLARGPRPLTLDPLAAAASLATADLAILAAFAGLAAGLVAGVIWRPVYRVLQRRIVPPILPRAQSQRTPSTGAARPTPLQRATIIRHEEIDRQRFQPWRQPVLPYAAPPEALEQRPAVVTHAVDVRPAASETTVVPGLKRFLARMLTATAIVGSLLAVTTAYYVLSRRALAHDMQAVDADRPQALLRFQIDRVPRRLVIDPVGGAAEVEFLLLDASRGVTVRSDAALRLGAPVRQPLEVSLQGMPPGEYYLRIQRTAGDLLFVYIVDQGGGWPASLALVISAALGAAELALLVLTVRGMYLASALGK